MGGGAIQTPLPLSHPTCASIPRNGQPKIPSGKRRRLGPSAGLTQRNPHAKFDSETNLRNVEQQAAASTFCSPPPFSCKVCRDAPLCRCRKRPLSKHGNAPLSSVCPPAPAKTTMALVFMLCLQGWLSTRAPSLPGPARPSRPARPPLHKNCLSAEPTGGGGRVF